MTSHSDRRSQRNPALDDALAQARDRYVAAHPRSAVLADRARRVLPGGNTRSVLHIEPFPFRVARADGAYLCDVLDGLRVVGLVVHASGEDPVGGGAVKPELAIKISGRAVDCNEQRRIAR